jgi:predicted alpha/beta hydrolase
MQAAMQDWGRLDLAGVIQWMHSELTPPGWFLIGHSAGGQMTGLAPNTADAAGLILVASQSGYWRLWPASAQLRWLWMWFALIPVLTRVYGYTPTSKLKFGEDLPAGVGLEWARWCRSPQFIVDASGKPIREGFRAFTSPIVAFGMEDDSNAPQRAIDELLGFYGSTSKEHQRVRPADFGVESIGHFGFFRSQFRDTLWRVSLDWMKNLL